MYSSNNVWEKSTFYVLDASGNVMSVYEHENDDANQVITYAQTEKHIYGSARLGTNNERIPMFQTQNQTYSMRLVTHRIGERVYELANHLGNVLSVISDKVIPHQNGTAVDYFLADIIQSTDYSGFGVQLSGRNFVKSGAKEFAFGFQGQLEDDEIKCDGNSVNYKYRMHDPRLGRFFAIDPLVKQYSWNSPYSFSSNRVLDGIELEGLEHVGFRNKLLSSGTYGDLKWHDYTNDSYNHVEMALKWVEEYHQGNINPSRVQSWPEEWYIVCTNMKDEHGRSTGTHLSFYENREAYIMNQPFKVKYEKDISQKYWSLGDGSEASGNHDGAGHSFGGGNMEKEIKSGAAIIITILTVGQGTGLVIAGEMTYAAGAKLTLDLASNADAFFGYTDNWSPEAKNVFNVLNMLSSSYSIKGQISDIATKGKGLDFFDTAGNLAGTLQIVDGAMQLSGGNDFIKTFLNIANGENMLDGKEE